MLESIRHLVELSEEVKDAQECGKPIVALESTIITHGMEYPQNLETALQVEQEIKDNGAVPATIAIIKGKIHIGLSTQQLEHMAINKQQFQKGSRRDLSYILITESNASSTVALTMILADLVNIRVFATGGIGGVHRGVETSFDISADLNELGRTKVCVISAGCKSILDIPKTLEYLETQGVPIVGHNTINFPAFFVTDSGQKCNQNMSISQISKLIHMQFYKLKLQTGIIVANPIQEQDQADGQIIEQAIQKSIQEMDGLGIKGAEVTPFLLKRVNELTQGMSSKSNVSLIRNNARVAAQIAVELQQLINSQE